MPTAYLTRIVEFTATHRFPDTPEFAGATDDHSHRYKCAVTVKGAFDPAALVKAVNAAGYHVTLEKADVIKPGK